MNVELIQSEEFQKLVALYEEEDVNQLALKFSKQKNFPLTELITQVEGRQKAKSKIPLFYSNRKLIYPSSVSLQQSSSQETAEYKSSLFTGNLLVDLTGGLGVDSYFFSHQFKKVIYIEREEEVSSIAGNNFLHLGTTTIEIWNTNSETALEKLKNLQPDLIYIDPSRRDELKRKVHSFSDCQPDVLSLLNPIFNIPSSLLIKASPMLDIKASLKELKYVDKVWVVSLNDECKELLFLIRPESNTNPLITCVELSRRPLEFTFTYEEEKESNSAIGLIEKFLFKPDLSIIKGGAFKCLAQRFGLTGLHVSTHLYTASQNCENFPGSVYEVVDTFKFDKEKIKKLGTVNMITRNVPYNSSELKQKWKIKESPDRWLFIYRDCNEKISCALTKRICR